MTLMMMPKKRQEIRQRRGIHEPRRPGQKEAGGQVEGVDDAKPFLFILAFAIAIEIPFGVTETAFSRVLYDYLRI